MAIVSYITSSGKTIVVTASDASDPTTYRYADTGQKPLLRNINGRWVDIETGEITNISTGGSVDIGGTLYATDNTKLYTVDPSTGDLTEIADTKVGATPTTVRNLWYRNGVMYCTPKQENDFYTIDLTTGAMVLDSVNPGAVPYSDVCIADGDNLFYCNSQDVFHWESGQWTGITWPIGNTGGTLVNTGTNEYGTDANNLHELELISGFWNSSILSTDAITGDIQDGFRQLTYATGNSTVYAHSINQTAGSGAGKFGTLDLATKVFTAISAERIALGLEFVPN
jgi:hypothetical protein